MILDIEELEILLTSVDLIKDFSHLSKRSALLNKLINKINLFLQCYIDENLKSQKVFSTQKLFEPISNELISLFNKAKEPITISIDENIKYANTTFYKMLGYESENEIVELGLFNLISKQCFPKIKNLYDKLLKGEIVPNIHNLELKRVDGEIITIECVHYAIPFNKSYFIISFYISYGQKSKKGEKKKTMQIIKEFGQKAKTPHIIVLCVKPVKMDGLPHNIVIWDNQSINNSKIPHIKVIWDNKNPKRICIWKNGQIDILE